ncbi:MAG: hypothetical protein Q9181_005965 [Wetmoreana brouardii]
MDGLSTGRGSQCISGNIKVTATATNFNIKYGQPPDQLAVTEFSVEMLQVNSNLMKRVLDGPSPVSGNWIIYSSLCLPADPVAAKNVKTVQILTHGDTLSSSYWDIAPGYSYVDAATVAGHATFSFDRIGVGRSEHPDPIQIAQAPLHLEITHALVVMLRKGQIGQRKFSHFVGVGHSAGSTVIQVFEATVRDKDTNSIGELLTLGTIVAPSPAFTGPVDVVLGENDLIFCGGNCATPVDQAAAVQPLFYPNASAGSRHYLAAGAGHSINAHFSAKAAWAHQLDFLKLNGL